MTADNLANVKFVGALGSNEDLVWARAFNGTEWSDWTSWTLRSGVGGGTGGGAPPTVSAGTGSVQVGGSVAAASLFSASAAGGGAVTYYEFWDSGDQAGTGYFTVNGAAQGANQTILVSAAQLSGVNFIGGTASGSETLWVRAFDDKGWSEWASWTMNTGVGAGGGGTPPTASASNGSVAANGTVGASSLFSVSDPDNRTITQYEFWDSNDRTGSGYFTVGGAAQGANQTISVSSTQLANVNFVGGTSSTTDQVWVRAYNGSTWSEWISWNMDTGVGAGGTGTPPVVSASNGSAAINTGVGASSLFSVSDPGGRTITQYEFWDSNDSAGSGYFSVSGAAQGANQTISVSSAQLSNVNFVGGTGSTSDLIWARAYNGSTWSEWKSWTMNTGVGSGGGGTPPTVSASNGSVAANAATSASSLFSVSSPSGGAITHYEFWDSNDQTGSGYFTVGGTGQGANQTIMVSASQLSGVNFVGGTSPTSDQVWVRAYDGTTWSEWKDWTMSTGAAVATNHAPVVSVRSSTTQMTPSGNMTPGGYIHSTRYYTNFLSWDFFSVHDADGQPHTAFQVRDLTSDASSGYFEFASESGGVKLSAGQVYEYSTAEVGSLSFVSGHSGSDTLSVRAYDGQDWGDWTDFTVQYRNPLTSLNATVGANSTTPLSSLMTLDASANTSAITGYRVGYDPFNGYLSLNGQRLSWGDVVSTSDISNVQLVQQNAWSGSGAGFNIAVIDNLGGDWFAQDSATAYQSIYFAIA